MSRETVGRAEELLARCDTVSLASVTAEGYPRVCVLSRMKNEGLRSVYVTTGADSRKTGQFRANPKAGLCFCRDGDSVTLVGRVTVVEDEDVKRDIWQDWLQRHFKGVDDPNYCVLRFDTLEATLWIRGEFETCGAGELTDGYWDGRNDR